MWGFVSNMLWSGLSLSPSFLPHIGCCGLPGRQLNITAIHSFPLHWDQGEKQKKSKLLGWENHGLEENEGAVMIMKKEFTKCCQRSPSITLTSAQLSSGCTFYCSSWHHPVWNNPPAAWIHSPGSVSSQLLSTCSQPAGRAAGEAENSLGQEQPNHQCGINTVLILEPKHSTEPELWAKTGFCEIAALC